MEYHIYVCAETEDLFENEIKNLGFDKTGVKVVCEIINDKLTGKIIIPTAINSPYVVESKLFDFKINSTNEQLKKSGFWGQYAK